MVGVETHMHRMALDTPGLDLLNRVYISDISEALVGIPYNIPCWMKAKQPATYLR